MTQFLFLISSKFTIALDDSQLEYSIKAIDVITPKFDFKLNSREK